jgi:Meiotically up-regulated gene 113
MSIDPRDPLSIRTLSRGRCYLYVAPCVYEDLLKLGFSRDPLERLQSLHRRWFEAFDLDRTLLVETESVRDARALELGLRRELAQHNAPAPLTVEREAGGHSEWYRGAYDRLAEVVNELATGGHRVYVPARSWLRQALLARSELLYSWTQAMLSLDELELRAGATPSQRAVRDVLDAFTALDIGLDERLSPEVLQWYRAGGGMALP